jgi:hypothetical protein
MKKPRLAIPRTLRTHAWCLPIMANHAYNIGTSEYHLTQGERPGTLSTATVVVQPFLQEHTIREVPDAM